MSEENGRSARRERGAHGSLDGAIDRAVREMMNVDADGAFRARVLARLDRGRAGWSSPWRLAIAAAVIAAVVIVVTVPRVSREREGASPAALTATRRSELPPRPDRRAAAAAPASAAAEPRASRATRRPPARPNVTQELPAGMLSAAVADEPADSTIPAIPALDSIDPIAIEPLRSPPIETEPIVVAPLSPMAAVQIAPLSPQIERD